MPALRLLKSSGTPSLDRAVREALSSSRVLPLPISSAVGEKLAALMTQEYFDRAKLESHRAYEAVLRKGRDVPAEEKDRLSNKRLQLTRPAKARRRGPRS